MEWIDIKLEEPSTEGKYLVKTLTSMGNIHRIESICHKNKGKMHFNCTNQIVTHWLKEK